jgi:hypothetical protein
MAEYMQVNRDYLVEVETKECGRTLFGPASTWTVPAIFTAILPCIETNEEKLVCHDSGSFRASYGSRSVCGLIVLERAHDGRIVEDRAGAGCRQCGCDQTLG